MANLLTPNDASKAIVNASATACQEINNFSRTVFKTRGGRLGSGMGLLIEAMWGYYVNQALMNAVPKPIPCEIGWLSDHEYNDFACVSKDMEWDPSTRTGELLRIEAKSMNNQVDESKGHFDQLLSDISEYELLLIVIWCWEAVDNFRVSPIIKDQFISLARPIAIIRDKLHLSRGGTFVSKDTCPDGCEPSRCKHGGEPLNAAGKRERLSGPESRRPSSKVSFASNYGGLVRMLKTNSADARDVFRSIRKADPVVHSYISFIHRNFPAEERNHFLVSDWRQVAEQLGQQTTGQSRDEVIEAVRKHHPDYQDHLRDLP